MDGPQVWHIRMRQGEGKNQRDYADDAFNGSYIGLGCSQCYKIAAFDPLNITDSTIDEIEANEKWSKGQIRRFIRSMRIDDLVLLSKKDSQFLGVGKVEARLYFASGEPLPLRRRVKWINREYKKQNLLGLGYFGLGSLARKPQLSDYAEEIVANKKIRIRSIQYSEANRAEALQSIKDRFDVLLPSYFEDLVRFLSEQMGFRVTYFEKSKSNDGGIDFVGWRTKNLFPERTEEKERYIIQVKRTGIKQDHIQKLRENLELGQMGILVSSIDSKRASINSSDQLQNIRIVNGSQLAEYVLEYHDKLPNYLGDIFKISKDD